jgi:hypothetical protein
MADTTLVNSKSNAAPNAIEDFYTSPSSSAGTLITAFSAVNNSAANASYKAYIYDSAGTALGAVIPFKIVVKNKYDVGPSITNQLIPNGGSLRMESSAAGSITFRVSGVVL